MIKGVEILINSKGGKIEIKPDFNSVVDGDIMTRGGKFYAVWDAENNIWSTNEFRLISIVDAELWERAKQFTPPYVVKTMSSYSSGILAEFRRYSRDTPNNYKQLDNKVTFSDQEVKREDYVSKRLPYSLQDGDCSSYRKIMTTLYEPEERQKIEWAIGSIFTGDSINIQKFLVLYGEGGKGKSTVLHIIEQLFDGYWCAFDAKSIGSSNNRFSLEPFKNNPLVAIQHDGDLSRIEDNSKLNSIVSNEEMVIDEKGKSLYSSRINAMCFMGTNKPVKITDAKSGIIRRLIDVRPSGRLLDPEEYFDLTEKIQFELGAIAKHCIEVYKKLGKNYYMAYKPLDMMFKTDPFYNFVENCYDEFSKNDGVSLKVAWEMYKNYCEDASLEFKMPMYKFREELKNYFREFKTVTRIDGKQVRSYFQGFEFERFKMAELSTKDSVAFKESKVGWIEFKKQHSLFDQAFGILPAQLADSNGNPRFKWANVKTMLSSIDTSQLHWVKVPENLICIDFDIKDETGEKSLELNLEAANKFPKTYAELSQSGKAIHLYYYWDGDVSKLSHVYKNDIEIKVYTGNASLRRKLTLCNDIVIARLNSGLPLKGEKKVINREAFKSETAIRALIERNLNKEIHAYTAPSVDFIYKILEQAYEQYDLSYDVRDMKQDVLVFAMKSHHQSDKCLKLVSKMHFVSKDIEENEKKSLELIEEGPNHYNVSDPITFFDVEVFPNLFIVVYKTVGMAPVAMINPTAIDIEQLLKMKLVGFNCRDYDNHILYARLIGYDNYNLYLLSQNIISGAPNSKFGQAYNLSYTDVYDFCSKKQSLKKWEIELDLHHQECPYKWDQDVPEDKWDEVASYCTNDVLATEAVFNANQGDFIAREILADLTGMTVNDKTNNLTARLIFGKEKNPKLYYTDLATGEQFDGNNVSLGIKDVGFPGYEYKKLEDGKYHNMYRGVDLGRGGYTDGIPGMYYSIGLLDVESLHPHSMIAMNLFGEHTKKFKELLDTRMFIKHKDYESAKKLFDGKLVQYLDDPSKAKALSKALKIAINSVYGLTSASFDNPFRDKRNVNNIVALRGALFMKTLQDELTNRGFTVAHLKVDSVKIPHITKEAIDFCMDFAAKYGYRFEHEATYERMCLVNDAVYIAKYLDNDTCKKMHGYIPSANAEHFENETQPWTATAAQFQHPYVFKYLFSKEEIKFKDMCETKSVKTAMYLDLNEKLPQMSEMDRKEYEAIIKLEKEKDPDKAGKLRERLFKKYGYRDNGDLKNRFDDLTIIENKSHNYVFVGKTGLFCPIKPGYGGGLLMRESDNGFTSVGGTKDYRWLESERVLDAKLQDAIDLNYFRKLVDDAVDNISNYGDFYEFAEGQSKSNENETKKIDLSEPIVFDITSDELPF